MTSYDMQETLDNMSISDLQTMDKFLENDLTEWAYQLRNKTSQRLEDEKKYSNAFSDCFGGVSLNDLSIRG